MRKKQRNKKASKEHFRPDVLRWHALTRERCIRMGFSDDYDSKWGRFKPQQRFNVDQSPLPFAVDRGTTYELLPEKEKRKNHKVWIANPGAGLEKRQCSLQICFRPVGEQPKLGIVFRGKGNISEAERAAYPDNVDVFFQSKAWVDTPVCLEWLEKTLSPIVKDENRFVIFMDNLTAQCADEFKQEIASHGGLAWYVPKNTTDITQPADSGYAELLKCLIKQAQDEWLLDETNADKWYGVDQKFTASERRILIAFWSSEGYYKLCQSDYDSYRWRMFEKTGCLMTADGSEDEKIQPEGLDNYVMPPPMTLLDPSEDIPVPQLVSGQDENEEEEEEEEETEPDTSEQDLQDGEEELKLDRVEDRHYAHGLVGKQLKINYHSGWFIGDIVYFNFELNEYKVEFKDGSSDYVAPTDIDGIEVIEI